MLAKLQDLPNTPLLRKISWRLFSALLMATFAGAIAALYLFVLLVDPYNVVAFSLPIERPIMSGSHTQRYTYPQIVRSGRFDSFIVGTSTARLLDPAMLNEPFHARFANLAMGAMTAWEQQTMVRFFVREAGPPKVLVFALDHMWCDPEADRNRVIIRPFPDWMYDDDRSNDYLYLLNTGTVTVAARLVGWKLGLYRSRVRSDGFEIFTPPESRYDLTLARSKIWGARSPSPPPDLPPPTLSDGERRDLQFPALQWLDEILGRLPGTIKVLAYMPVHVASQPRPGTHAAAVEAECKARIAASARNHGGKVIDWRIASPITTVDSNYWDGLHYRLPIAELIVRELASAVVNGSESTDGHFRVVVR